MGGKMPLAAIRDPDFSARTFSYKTALPMTQKNRLSLKWE
jgi:hypothetical protein